ncbi:MAG: Vat family streptogramin A O-acetyltransferase [bacterium]|nr:Vat family streptogramin A O-acetyltransferase [bacterium]
MNGPDPTSKHPVPAFPQICFLKNIVTNPNIIVGDYTYYDDPVDPDGFERNVLYHYPFMNDKLIIGKFCAIARDAKFMMNGANHKLTGFSTYPFGIFPSGWEAAIPKLEELPYRGDTVIGNDVWIGYDALILPGVKIGHGAIIATRSLVATRVPPYAVVGGNPARILRMRFSPEIISELLKIAWWNWEIEKVTRNLSHIVSGNLEALMAAE